MAVRFIFVVAIVIFTNSTRLEAGSLGICNGLDGSACAEAIFHSDKEQWLADCKDSWNKNSAIECLQEMKKCLPQTVQELKKFGSFEDIYEEVGFCFVY